MKHFIILCMLLLFFTNCKQQNEERKEEVKMDGVVENSSTQQKTTYYLIRHGEKMRTNPNDPDPSLDIDGMVRAKDWATYFEPMRIDEIYITKFKRTKQTASLIAQQKMITPKRYEPNALYSEDFLKKTNGKNVLIVGHSNTIPQLVNKLIGEKKYEDMYDTEYGTLFTVTLDGSEKKVTRITVE